MNAAWTRRQLLQEAVTLSTAVSLPSYQAGAHESDKPPAQVAITFDLEMSRHYPTWDQTHWDYEKGNLDGATKRYAVEAARRVKQAGGRIHFFAVGRVLEQEDVSWLEELIREGHPVGNHTYDHVNVKATRSQDIQFRFQRAPWLIHDTSPSEVIAENIRLTTLALKQRVGITPAGFRTPGGFSNGLIDREDVQRIILDQGFRWVSSLYPVHPIGTPGSAPSDGILDEAVKLQSRAQPFAYSTGLVEVPMSPVSDVTAMRAGRWPLESFLRAVRLGVTWAIDHGAVFDLLVHPSCLVVTDPEFQTIRLVCDLVRQAGPRATLVDLEAVAQRFGKDAPKEK